MLTTHDKEGDAFMPFKSGGFDKGNMAPKS